MDKEEIKKELRRTYGSLTRDSGCCGSSCGCGGGVSEKLGYGDDALASVPEGADLGLGCGNPTAFAALREGEVVLDLGSGAGLDCFIAAERVGPSGRVIGVDMTPEMIGKARTNAVKGGYGNVEFRLGEIESLPVEDVSVDVVISNCVINLSTDKARVFREAFRALQPGGRLLVSDIVLTAPLPEWLARSMAAYSACISGAEQKDRYLSLMEDAGFREISLLKEIPFTPDPVIFSEDRGCCGDRGTEHIHLPGDPIRSITVYARKPSTGKELQ